MEIKTIVFWVLMAAFIIPSFIFGYQKLIGQKQKAEQFNRFGYPLWFMRIIGLAEIIGCFLLLIHETRNIGVMIFAIIFAGAIYTHIKQKDPKKETMAPVIVLIHLLAIFLFTIWV